MFIQDRLNISSERVYTDEGYLLVPSRISRVGIQVYLAIEMGLVDRDPTDTINVYRPPEEVFSDVSLASFVNKPVTNNHPPELVNASNYKTYSVGNSGNEVVKDGMFVKADLIIMDIESIKDIESGKSELSNGYLSDIEWTPGVTPEGENYDAIQRNIKGNHIAIVERGRAGPACRVADNLPNLGDNVIMAKITIDGVDFEVPEQAAQAVGKLQARLSDAEKETQTEAEKVKAKEDEMEEAAKTAKAKEDSLEAKLDDAKSKILTNDAVDKLVASRAKLADTILKICPDIKLDGKDNLTLVKEVVADKCPTINMDSVSTDYIQARFDMLVESIDNNSQQHLDDAFKTIVNNDSTKKVEDTRSESVIAREKFQVDSREAWKKKGDK